MHVKPIHADHIVAYNIETEAVTYLQDNGYVVDVHPAYVVTSESGNGYLINRIETHTTPFEYADAVEDRYTLYECTCDAYRYQQGLPNLAESRVVEWEPCKHQKAAIKELRAENDENQAELDL